MREGFEWQCLMGCGASEDKVALLPSDLVEDKEGNAHPPAWVEYTKVPSLKSALIFCMGHTGVLFPGDPMK